MAEAAHGKLVAKIEWDLSFLITMSVFYHRELIHSEKMQKTLDANLNLPCCIYHLLSHLLAKYLSQDIKPFCASFFSKRLPILYTGILFSTRKCLISLLLLSLLSLSFLVTRDKYRTDH